MKLRKVRIEGFKSIKNISFELKDFLCFIGQNNHGKSNIFQALELFFSSSLKNSNKDIFHRNHEHQAEEIIIECIFDNLSNEEREKLKPWMINTSLTVLKKYSIEENKLQASYQAITEIPENDWLNKDFEDYSKRDIVSKLPINEFIQKEGRITKDIYENAVNNYIEKYKNEIKFRKEYRENPSGFKQVLDGYLPQFHLIPAVKDLEDEIKTTGSSYFSKILETIISRIANQNPAFVDLQKSIIQIKTLIEGRNPDEKLQEIKDIEKQILKEMNHWNVELDINMTAPTIEEVFRLLEPKINLIDDGIKTDATEKGHGLQRSLLFALIRVWANEMSKMANDSGIIRERSHIFAFEEPEIFLHPQMCKATYDSLKKISEMDQVLLCTHSPHFIDMDDYRNIVIVKKDNSNEGTTLKVVSKELFEEDKKERFNMIRFFNPDRNELFFAKKVILVEGATEKSFFPFMAKRLNYFDHKVSIIDCGGKHNLTLFMSILNEFKMPYLVVHDEDPIKEEFKPGGKKYDSSRYAELKRHFEENRRIRDECNPSVGSIRLITGKLEDILGISKTQGEKLGKPLAAIEKYSNSSTEIPKQIEELVREIYR